ncbi:hypothetical protein ACJ72_03647 [Emergomyces africanus]|uniref:Uncharacterized protein n=1 Tax=Emergomyces africanus TaxID=1955775 RepID=A0A1B7NZ07_9EURO|nr:hypothetical protein ACJ72_03647 [Emergomyces africanus]
MPFAGNSILRASVLPQILDVLQRLADNPEQLGRERLFDEPPPPYPPSGETTQPPSPHIRLSEADRRWQRREERLNPTPCAQFMYQWRFEEKRILEQIRRRFVRRKETLPYVMGLDFNTNAENNVKNRWIEQGIWDDAWPRWARGRWKHAEPPEPDSESDSELITSVGGNKSRINQVRRLKLGLHVPTTSLFSRYPKSANGLKTNRTADKLISMRSLQKRQASLQKIWNPKWGHTPGMTWMHEEPEPDDDNSDSLTSGESLPNNGVENNEQPARRRRYCSHGWGYATESSASPEPTRPTFAPRITTDSNGEGRTASNESMASSTVPKNPDNTETSQEPEELGEPVNRALRANGTSKVRKRAKRKPPTRQLRNRLSAASGPSDIPQNIVATTTESPLAEGDAEPCHTASISRPSKPDESPGEHQPILRRSSRISSRSGTSEFSMSYIASVDTSKPPQLR